MKKSVVYLAIIPVLLLSGCRSSGRDSSTGDISTSGTTATSSTSGSTETSNSTSTNTSSNTSIPSTSEIKPEGVISIDEANQKGEAYKTSVPTGSHEYFSNDVVTTKGQVIQAIAIGVSQNILVYIADGDAFIPILTNGQSAFYNACKDYIGKETSNYYITGKIGYYYGQPTINISSYQLDQSMTFHIDYDKYISENYTEIDTYNNYLIELEYNKKGYGQGDIVSLNSMLCIAKADNNSWLFTDGNYVQGAYHQTSNTAFTIGKVYNMVGISCLYQWKPSLRVLDYKTSTETITVDIPTLAEDHFKTATEMYSIGAFTDDTEKSAATDKFVQTFKYFYKSSVYINAYGQAANGYYTVAGDKYYKDLITSKNTASDNRMFIFNNDDLNKYTDTTYVSVRDYLLEEIQVDIYFVEYQFTQANKRMMPQVYLFEEFIPRLSFPDVELRNFFSGQTYLINEGTIPMYVGGSEYVVLDYVNEFKVLVKGIDETKYNQHKNDCDNNDNIKLVSSTEITANYIHKQTNPKFTYAISFDSLNEAMTITINKA